MKKTNKTTGAVKAAPLKPQEKMKLNEAISDFRSKALERINEAILAKDYKVISVLGNKQIEIDGNKVFIWNHPSYYIQNIGFVITLYGDHATDEDRRIHSIISTIGDTEEMKQLQREIEEAQKKLKQMRDDFDAKSKDPDNYQTEAATVVTETAEA